MRKLNVIGHKCPLPILKLSKELAQMQSAEQVQLIADDKATILDIPAFVRQTGHKIISQTEENLLYIFVIEKK